ncbi:Protein kinase protein with adenine nucleotide alpha hydrolase-like domain [Abeliophyllum distichum]|uniref:RING-type E3 ubiquitin transferase n=1 Tax=Abeliophyllum distichum TaxID=126358 RepID=A0ABD1TYU6_9LAMI
MPPQIPHDDNPTVVAVDKDKHSLSAVRWAIDHLLISNPTLILIHVKTKNSQNQNSNGVSPEANGGSFDDIFSPFRAYCARKGIIVKEVVVEGNDVSNSLIDYINNYHVTNMVLGGSSRSPISRKFWTHDVPTLINKAAPDFCSVYVIVKGKTQSIRPAARHAASSTPPRLPSTQAQLPVKFNHFEPDARSRANSIRELKDVGSDRIRPQKIPGNESMDNYDIPSRVGSKNSPGHISLDRPIKFGSIDITTQNLDFTYIAEGGDDRYYSSSQKEVEAEMKRLKLEVRQTMDMYNHACKEAVSAQQKAKEIHQWKLEEARRLEQARLKEGAAIAIVEMEKAKCKAATEAAEKAQKIAEMETQRRKYAELKVQREAEEKKRALSTLTNNDVRYRKYTIEEIEAATNHFSSSNKIGEGGYGPVFRGTLDHTPVAIKVLRSDAAQGRKQFQQEVEVLSSMRHPNMVLLLGACPEYGCLVYEFMSNGSLEDRLFKKGNTAPLPWDTRFKIAADIATALLFLHQAKPEPLVHRDLKPANILLDYHYVCKISDVGLARLVPPSVADNVTQYHMTSAAGTFCYIDPEYQQTGKLGTKSDIYSFGVMLLQIITARPPMGLTHHVENAIKNGTFTELLDPTVQDWPIEEALSFAKLALKCAELRKRDRPDLGSDVLPELNRLKDIKHWEQP